MFFWGFLIVIAVLATGLATAFALEWWAAGRRQRHWLEQHADDAASAETDSPVQTAA